MTQVLALTGSTYRGKEPFSVRDELPWTFDLTSPLGISQFYTDALHFVSCTKSTFLPPALYVASKGLEIVC